MHGLARAGMAWRGVALWAFLRGAIGAGWVGLRGGCMVWAPHRCDRLGRIGWRYSLGGNADAGTWMWKQRLGGDLHVALSLRGAPPHDELFPHAMARRRIEGDLVALWTGWDLLSQPQSYIHLGACFCAAA